MKNDVQELPPPAESTSTWEEMRKYADHGKFEEATGLFNRIRALQKPVSREEKVASFFFYAVMLIRRSRYRDAYSILKELRQAAKESANAWNQFFYNQGYAFFGIYSDAPRALKFASPAVLASIETGRPLFQILARDISGHLNILNGKIRKGLADFEEARKIAEKSGNTVYLQAIKISILKFEAYFGLHGKKSFLALESGLNSLHPEDVYSFAELGLEYARQLSIRGYGRKASEILDRVCAKIYRHGVKRQIFSLNLRYAYLHALDGNRSQALNLIQISLQSLHPYVDEGRRLQAEGFLCDYCLEGQTDSGARSFYPHTRMLDRKLKRFKSSRGDDPIGDLIDDLSAGDKKAVERAIQLGLFGLLRNSLLDRERLGSSMLIFDILPGLILLADQSEVRVPETKLQGQSRELLILLASLSKGVWISKEEIILRIWNYDYHPIRHDQLIYSAVAKLRKVFGDLDHLIESSELGYRLCERLQIYSQPVLREKSQGETALAQFPLHQSARQSSENLLPSQGLNYRQQQILRLLAKNDYLSVSECASKLGCSIPTACRDLRELCNRALIERSGNTRATRYQKLSS